MTVAPVSEIKEFRTVALGKDRGGPPLNKNGYFRKSIGLVRSTQPADDCVVPADSRHFLTIHQGEPVDISRFTGKSCQQARIVRGSINIIPAGHSDRWAWTEACDSMKLHLDEELVDRIAVDVAPKGTQAQLIEKFDIRDGLIESISTELLAELGDSKDEGGIYVEWLLQALAVHLVKRYSAQVPHTDHQRVVKLTKAQVRRVAEYIADRLDQSISISDLADQVSLSPFHFARGFKGATGLPPHQYLVKARVERAKDLLSRSTASLGDVAIQAGFASQSHMHRHFRRFVGISPGKFRTSFGEV